MRHPGGGHSQGMGRRHEFGSPSPPQSLQQQARIKHWWPPPLPRSRTSCSLWAGALQGGPVSLGRLSQPCSTRKGRAVSWPQLDVTSVQAHAARCRPRKPCGMRGLRRQCPPSTVREEERCLTPFPNLCLGVKLRETRDVGLGGREASWSSVYGAACAQPCAACVQGGPPLHVRFPDRAVVDIGVGRCRRRDGRRGVGGSLAHAKTPPPASRSRGSQPSPPLIQGHSGGRGTGQPRQDSAGLVALALLPGIGQRLEATEELARAAKPREAARPAPRAAPSAPRRREPADGKRSLR